ncbi:YceI family protein [Acidobacteria bacterium AB60]|nr:YceI family protein [Acidobacteria bacterium AB60]
MKAALLLLMVAAIPAGAQADSQWVLEQSTLSYHMSHPMHEVDGVSHAAKGKGVCHDGQCDFLIAAPVRTFDSGDTNRDLHMLETTKGAQFPMVVVKTHFPASELNDSTLYADLEVQFAGQTARYQHVAFQRSGQGKDVRITGTMPATCSDFKIERPTFLTVPIKNEIPVKVEMTWRNAE